MKFSTGSTKGNKFTYNGKLSHSKRFSLSYRIFLKLTRLPRLSLQIRNPMKRNLEVRIALKTQKIHSQIFSPRICPNFSGLGGFRSCLSAFICVISWIFFSLSDGI